MKKLIIIILIIIIGSSVLYTKDLIEYPAISPDLTKLAFTYRGDVWIYNLKSNLTTKLTHNVDMDYRPIWSPDGEYVGFTSNRNGGYDVYVVKSSGGVPKRITYNSNFDGLYDWGLNNKLYIGSYRDIRGKRAYMVDLKNKIPEKIVDYDLFKVKRNSKNQFLSFSDGTATWRRNYKGSNSRNLIMYDKNKDKIKYIQKDEYMNTFPVWGEQEEIIYFISNRKGNANIFKKNLKTGKLKQVTDFKNKDVQWLYGTKDGRALSFIADFEPFIYYTDTDKLKRLDFEIDSDYQFTHKKIDKIGYGNMSEAEVSTDGKNIIFVCEGDLLFNDTDQENDDTVYPKNLTDSIFWEKEVVWAKNNEIIAFVSTKSGFQNIHIMDKNGKFEKQITNSRSIKDSLQFSPKGKYLLYVEDLSRLKIHNMKNHEERLLLDMPVISGIKWSPDGKKILVRRYNEAYNSEIYIISRDGGFKRNISMTSEDCYSPVWKKNGKEIYWIVNGLDSNKVVKLNIDINENNGIDIKKDDDFIIQEKQEVIYETSNESIDDIAYIGKEEKIVLIQSDKDNDYLYTVDLNNDNKARRIKTRSSIDSLRVNEENKRIYFLSDGSFNSVTYTGRNTEVYDAVVFKKFNKKKEFEELFNESWSLLYHYFYDRQMHGINWKNVKKYYKEFIDKISMKRDLYTIIDEMLGELNASHLGIWGKRERSHNTNYRTAYFGVSFNKNLEIEYINILSDVRNKVKYGDKLLSIDDEKISTPVDMDKALLGKVNKKVDLYFENAGKIENVECKSWRDYNNLYRKEETYFNRKKVEKETNSRVAYIYIRSMGNEDLIKFKRELGSYAYDKEALIIDVRNNGGGYIGGQLLGMLERNIYAYSKHRFMDKKTEQPAQYGWTKPVVVLINEHSFSNAEIFPSGFKALKLGKVVGVTTAGGVIGTYNVELMDGTTFRLPTVKWISKKGENLENFGVKPDIYIENTPEDVRNDRDPQLKKAIEVILKDLKK